MKTNLAVFVLIWMNCASVSSQTNAKFFCMSAYTNFCAGRYESAITNLTAEIAINPNDYAYLHRGMCKERLRDYTGAISDYDKAIQLNPASGGNSDDNAYFRHGICKDDLQDQAGAISDYGKAIQLNPQCAGYYCNRGRSKFRMGDMAGAVGDYNKAIDLDSKMAMAYFNRGQLKYCADKNFAGAVKDFTKAIELHTDPQEDDLFFARANAKMQLKDFAGAIADFKEAIRLNPNFGQAQTNLVTAQESLRASEKK